MIRCERWGPRPGWTVPAPSHQRCERRADYERCDCGCGLYLCSECNAEWLATKRKRDLIIIADHGLAGLLAKLPGIDPEGWYFELRKFEGPDPWTCAKTNVRLNKDAFTNTGAIPGEAVLKMLRRIGTEI